MIFRWHICFSILLASGLSAATVSGRVELRDSREKSVQRGRDYSGVVLWLEPVRGKAPAHTGPQRATMLQKGKKFLPHLLAVRTGTVVDFPNLDAIFHNAFSNFSGQLFDIGLYKPGSTRSVTFNRPGAVRVFCNIHSSMSAVIVVVDSPWFATTAADGTFRIAGAPPGEYRLQVFHERATSAELDRAGQNVSVSASEASPLEVTISENGFLTVPHLNKHGKEYSASDETYKGPK